MLHLKPVGGTSPLVGVTISPYLRVFHGTCCDGAARQLDEGLPGPRLTLESHTCTWTPGLNQQMRRAQKQESSNSIQAPAFPAAAHLSRHSPSSYFRLCSSSRSRRAATSLKSHGLAHWSCRDTICSQNPRLPGSTLTIRSTRTKLEAWASFRSSCCAFSSSTRL